MTTTEMGRDELTGRNELTGQALADRVGTAIADTVEHLASLVAIPSVSAAREHRPDVERSAELVAALLTGVGMESAQVVRIPQGLPAVIATRRVDPDAPTVLLYAHHDVQPHGATRHWTTDPFMADRREDRIHGRGTSDDKGGIAVHLAALAAWGDDLPVNVTVLVEGEEEIGSPTLPQLLQLHAQTLRPDVVVVPDSVNHSLDTPALTTSLRGLVEVVVEVRTLRNELHSGLWGGVAPDALTTMVHLLATLHTPAGDVAVSGLRDGDRHGMDLPEDGVRREAGILPGERTFGTGSITNRLWRRPSLTVTGLDVPSVDKAAARLLPAVRAKISLRIAPNDDPDDALAALTRHLRLYAPPGAEVTVTCTTRVRPCTIDTSTPVHEAARTALSQAWDGATPVEIGAGGSIPFVGLLQEAFPTAAMVVTAVQDPASRAHGTDESVHVDTLRRACVAEALFLQLLGASARRRPVTAPPVRQRRAAAR